MIYLGPYIIYLAFAASLLSAALYYYSNKKQDTKIYKLSGWLVVLVFILVSMATYIMESALIGSDFRLKYVAEYTSLDLALVYKITALWAGQSGSILFWLLILCILSAIEAGNAETYSIKFGSWIMIMVNLTLAFFLFLLIFIYPPFELTSANMTDGIGLNPVLQHIAMTYHPPILYFGYAAMVFPFAYAMSGLINKDLRGDWLERGRGWALFGWIVLTIGIILGGRWAYTILGWGGYWAWDPVENASVFPWFAITAYLHASLIYRYKKRFIVWTFMLATMANATSIFGTFLTRSGVIVSVHAFSKSFDALWFLSYVAAIIALCAYLIYKNREELMVVRDFKIVSLEGILLIVVILFLVINTAYFIGTLSPLVTGIYYPVPISMTAGYYNNVSIVLFGILFGLMMLFVYKFYGPRRVRMIAIILTFTATITIISIAYGYNQPIASAFLALALGALGVSVARLGKLIYKKIKLPHLYAGWIVHLGVAVATVGIIFSSFYKVEEDLVLQKLAVVNVNEYKLELQEAVVTETSLYLELNLPIRLSKNEEYIGTLVPVVRKQKVDERINATPSIYSEFTRDINISFRGLNEDGFLEMTIFIEPYIILVWIGSIIMGLGGTVGFLGVVFTGKKNKGRVSSENVDDLASNASANASTDTSK